MPDNLTIGIGADTSKLRADLAIAEAEVRQFAAGLRQASTESLKTGDTSKVQELSGAFEQARVRVAGLRSEMTQLTRAHQEHGNAITQLAQNFIRLRQPVEAVHGAFQTMLTRTLPGLSAAIAGLTLGALGRELVTFTEDAAKSVKAVTDLSEALGATAGQVQGMQLAAAQAGAPIDALTSTMTRLTRQIGEARIQTRNLTSADFVVFPSGIEKFASELTGFERLGINLARYSGTFAGTQKLIADTVKALALIPNAAERDAISIQALGKSWFEANQILQSQKGIEAAQATLKSAGLEISASEQRAADARVSAQATFVAVLDRTRNLVGNIIGQQLIPLFNGLTALLKQNRDSIVAWANTVSTYVGGVVRDILAFMQGQNVPAQTQLGDTIIKTFTYIRDDLIPGVTAAFNQLWSVLGQIANTINSVFGTKFTADTLLVIGFIGQLTGAFNLLAGALSVVGGLLVVGGSIAAAISPAGWIVLGAIAFNAAVITLTGSWQVFGQAVSDIVKTIGDGLNYLIKQASYLISLLPGASQTPVSGAATPMPTLTPFAGGGAVPGIGTGDIVPALLTPGEFVNRLSSVRHYGIDVFRALNAQRIPREMLRGYAMGGLVDSLHAPVRGFAEGGLVSAADGRSPVHLHLGGHQFPLQGSSGVVDALVAEAGRYQMRSAGLKPSWYGGRPNG